MGADQGELSHPRCPTHGLDHGAVQRLDVVKRAGGEGLLGDPGRVLEHAAEQLDEALALQRRQVGRRQLRRGHTIRSLSELTQLET